MSQKLVDMITRHEGKEPHAYQDSLGVLTIGIGRNVDKGHNGPGLSDDEMAYMLENDIIQHRKELIYAYSWFNDLDETRQDALIDMHMNLGHTRFRRFKKMIAALEVGDHATAKEEMLDSLWATQTGARATELAYMVLTGEYKPQ
jgi:lysozyme